MIRYIRAFRQNIRQGLAIEENLIILFFWLGGIFAPITMWFLVPYCVKKLRHLPVGDEMFPYVILLMLIGICLSLWVFPAFIIWDIVTFASH